MESVFDINEDRIESGTQIIHVRNTELASALLSVGIPLRKDPPFEHVERADGEDIITYNFFPCSPDGSITAAECIQAWKLDIKFIEANPEHPFTFAMCAIKNVDQFREHRRTNVPRLAYQVYDKTLKKTAILLVRPNSKKHKKAIEEGLKQL